MTDDRYFALCALSVYNIIGLSKYYIYYVYLIIDKSFYFNYFTSNGGQRNLIVIRHLSSFLVTRG